MKDNVHTHLKGIRQIAAETSSPWNIMEVCGTHTMAVFQSGMRSLLPDNIQLISGPGCPVCVTPNEYLDKAISISKEPDTVLTSFGDMMRVPGTESSLEKARAEGADIRIVYSPADALDIARQNPQQNIVFLGVGFETTAPAVAWTIEQAYKEQLVNYSVLCGHKTMPNAMAEILKDHRLNIDGFICPGHVSTIIGSNPYHFLADKYRKACVITGFEYYDIAEGIHLLAQQLMEGRTEVEIQYRRAVNPDGNRVAQSAVETVFENCDTEWRGLGTIPRSGLCIKEQYSRHDAEKQFNSITVSPSTHNSSCRCGDVLKGICSPLECPLFKGECTPSSPVGPCMVSSEGTCAAYYKYMNA